MAIPGCLETISILLENQTAMVLGKNLNFDRNANILVAGAFNNDKNGNDSGMIRVYQLANRECAATAEIEVTADDDDCDAVNFTLPQSKVNNDFAPFALTGGLPTGGVYAGPGVSLESGVYTFDPSAAPIGDITITYTVDGCPALSDTLEVINVCSISFTSEPSADTYCEGEEFTLEAVVAPADGTAYEYQWSVQNVGETNFTDIAGADEAALTLTAESAGNGASYQLRVTNPDLSSCSITTTPATITVQDAPSDFTITGPTEYTAGTSGVTLEAPTGFTYDWSPGGETTQTISDVLEGDYTVTITNAEGCTTTSEVFTVKEIACPISVDDTDNSLEICEGNDSTISFTVNDGGATVSYQWQYQAVGATDYTDISGATNEALNFVVIAPSDKAPMIASIFR